MKEVVYEVWGEDTFAREEYLVGVYDTQEEANKILRESEQSALQICEELRDTYWICELTPLSTTFLPSSFPLLPFLFPFRS